MKSAGRPSVPAVFLVGVVVPMVMVSHLPEGWYPIPNHTNPRSHGPDTAEPVCGAA